MGQQSEKITDTKTLQQKESRRSKDTLPLLFLPRAKLFRAIQMIKWSIRRRKRTHSTSV